jgi:hypothetical protein
MAAGYILRNLADVEDSAIRFGIGDIQEARFANDDLEGALVAPAWPTRPPSAARPHAHGLGFE